APPGGPRTARAGPAARGCGCRRCGAAGRPAACGRPRRGTRPRGAGGYATARRRSASGRPPCTARPFPRPRGRFRPAPRGASSAGHALRGVDELTPQVLDPGLLQNLDAEVRAVHPALAGPGRQPAEGAAGQAVRVPALRDLVFEPPHRAEHGEDLLVGHNEGLVVQGRPPVAALLVLLL